MDGIVVTGMGIVSPLGTSVDAFISGLRDGVVAIDKAPWADDQHFAWWAPVKDFDPADWMDAKVADGSDPFTWWALAAATQAIDGAGLRELDPERTAVVHGTSMGGLRSLMMAQHQLEAHGPEAIHRKVMIQIWPNMAAAQIALKYGLHGPQLTVCTACASSIDAIGTAARLIASGEVDVAIAGGTEGGLSASRADDDPAFVPATFYSQGAYGMSTPERDRLRASLPFDRNRSGIATGDGSCCLVLERASHAEARGATPLAAVRGYASLADAHHPSSPEPSGKWERRVMERALADAGLTPDRVGAIVAHATATPVGDAAEIKAINDLHGSRAVPLPVISLKGHIGHTGAASGAMGAVVGITAMRDGVLPHTACTRDVDPEVRFHAVINEPIAVGIDCVQVNAFGFGGQNTSLVLTAP